MNRVKLIFALGAVGVLAAVGAGTALAQTGAGGTATTQRSTVRTLTPSGSGVNRAYSLQGQTIERGPNGLTVTQGDGKNVYRWINAFPTDKRVDVDLDEKRVGDAVKSLVERAKLDYDVVVDPDVSNDARVSLKAKNVRLSAVLDVIADAAGTNWGFEQKDKKTVIRLGKSARRSPFFYSSALAELGHGTTTLKALTPNIQVAPFGKPGGTAHGGVDVFVPGFFSETRSVFSCPHCKSQTTQIRVNQQPKCTKCTRIFQSDWQFCPADGSKRPAPPSDWRYCPMCGKEVQTQKSDSGVEELDTKMSEMRVPGANPFQDTEIRPTNANPFSEVEVRTLELRRTL